MLDEEADLMQFDKLMWLKMDGAGREIELSAYELSPWPPLFMT